jgi:hypothetical protein
VTDSRFFGKAAWGVKSAWPRRRFAPSVAANDPLLLTSYFAASSEMLTSQNSLQSARSSRRHHHLAEDDVVGSPAGVAGWRSTCAILPR